MIILGYFLQGIAQVLSILITTFIWLFIIRMFLSFVSPDPRNPIVQFLVNTTEPLLYRVRDKMPRTGMFDLSPFVVTLGLIFLQYALVGPINHYAEILTLGR